MLDQAANATAAIAIDSLSRDVNELRASITVTNKTCHKFPSGVGFRRAFVDFAVFDAADKVIWESGRTNLAGVLTDQNSQPIAGELWWKEDCSAHINSPGNNPHQPHYRTISQQNQVQIFQELVTTPPSPNAAATLTPPASLPPASCRSAAPLRTIVCYPPASSRS